MAKKKKKSEKFERITVSRKTTIEFSINDEGGLSIKYSADGFLDTTTIVIKRIDEGSPTDSFWVVPISLKELSKMKFMIDDFLKLYEREIEEE